MLEAQPKLQGKSQQCWLCPSACRVMQQPGHDFLKRSIEPIDLRKQHPAGLILDLIRTCKDQDVQAETKLPLWGEHEYGQAANCIPAGMPDSFSSLRVQLRIACWISWIGSTTHVLTKSQSGVLMSVSALQDMQAVPNILKQHELVYHSAAPDF